MKRALIVVMSVFIAVAVATPSFAVEFDASGSLRFQGSYNENAASNKDDKSDSFRTMRLRVRTDLKVNDSINLITRFDALDKVLSSKDSALESGEDDDNIDFDRAYMRYVSPIGLFMIGRQEGVTWGTPFADDEADTDRIKYVLPVPVGDGGDKVYLVAVAEKVGEYDKGTELSNKDNDKYYLAATYVSENYRTGFLLGFYHYNTFQDPGQATSYAAFNDAGGADAVQSYSDDNVDALAAGTSAAGIYSTVYRTAYDIAYSGYLDSTGGMSTYTAAHEYADAAATEAADNYVATDVDYLTYTGLSNTYAAMAASNAPAYAAYTDLVSIERGTTAGGKVWLLSPYFTGKFGGLGITTELDYLTGAIEYKDAAATYDDGDRDVAAYSFMFETSYETGPLGFQIGVATQSGDTDFDDDEINSMGYVSPGADWGKMFILSGSGSADEGMTHGMNTSLGNGMGNHVGDGFGDTSTSLLAGYQMLYLGADFDVTENLNLGTVMCMSKADDAPDGFDDDQGYEVDLTLSWQIMENLEYSGTAAYLIAGDYWKGENKAGDGEDTLALFHKLELSF